MPTGALCRTLKAHLEARYKPGRASSPEITVTSPDETVDVGDRKRGHETLLERRGSLRTDEMATNGGRARTPSPPVSPKEAQKRPNLSIFLLFYLRLRFLEAGALITAHLMIGGSPRASRIGRTGPRRAPKCARDAPHLGPSRTRILYYICGSQAFRPRFFALPSCPAVVRCWGCFDMLGAS